MTVDEIMAKLAKCGNATTKQTLLRHNVKEPVFGVKIGDLKPLQKAIGKDYQLSLALFDTGNADAQYLAGLIADPAQMTKRDLQKWMKNANGGMVAEYAVAAVTAESRYGFEKAQQWIKSPQESTAAVGWATLTSLVSVVPDDQLDLNSLKHLLQQIPKSIHDAPNRVRYCMNGYIIAAGCFVPELTESALNVAQQIGKVDVDMGPTSCKVPDAVTYIEKVKKQDRIGKKRKTAMC